MDRQTMSDIRRGEIIVPGGWTARIPSVALSDDEEHAIYLAHLQKQGYGPAVAVGLLRRRIQDTFNRGWTGPLREMIADRAEEFIEIHGSLDGYRPEEVQRAYFPGDRPGRAGKPGVRRMLLEMGREEADDGH